MITEPKYHFAQCLECDLAEARSCPSYFPEDHGWELFRDPPLVFVGQAPGTVELATKVPFTGPAGKVHYRICMESGIVKMGCPHLNIINCYPGVDAKGNDRKPSWQQVLNCRERLKYELQMLRPKLIVALGDEAMFALTRKQGIKGKRGAIFPLIDFYELDCPVYVELHPSFAQRQRQWIPLIVDNYKEVLDVYETGAKPQHKFKLILDPTAEELDQYLRKPGVVYGVDTEATGLSYFDDQIIGHSFAESEHSAVAVAYTSDDDPRRAVVTSFLTDPDRKKCWQNGSYDTGILEGQWGVVDQGFEFDTRLAQQLLASDLPSDLDFLRGHYTDIKPYKPSKKEYKQLASLGRDRILDLAARDAVTTYTVMQRQKKKLHDSQTKLMKELLIPLVRILNKVELRGVRVDEIQLASIYASLKPIVEERAQYWWNKGINPNAPKQLISYFGTRSSDEDTLKAEIKRNHPKADEMQRVLDYRNVFTTYSKYIVGIYHRLREDAYGNKRIHTHYKLEGTGTGRLASVDPNLQNVPDWLRSIYIPDEGFVFLSGDYKQIELWVMAILAEEWDMLNDLKNGVDVHFIASKLCFPDVPIVYNDRKRDFTHWQELAAKTVVFGTAYGRGKRSIGREFGVTDAVAGQWQDALLGRYPGLLNYKRKCENAFESDGFITTPFGRVRYLNSLTQGYNAPIQSTAADIMLTAFKMVWNENIYVPLTVYDDITSMLPLDNEQGDATTVKEIMTRKVPELGEAFRVDFKRGFNWYEMSKVEYEF